MKKILFLLVLSFVFLAVAPVMAKTIYFNNFNGLPVGLLSLEDFQREWNDPLEYPGVGERVFIAKEGWLNKVLAVFYPAGKVGPVEGGAEWRTYIGSYEEVILSYRVRFRKGFDFVRGGKLPGLCGGRELVTGGKVADGANGWSVRLMWNGGGKAKAYAYFPGKHSQWGEAYTFDHNGVKHFQPGKWHKIKIRVKMNTPGEENGVLQCWLDGELVIDLRDMVYRTATSLKINFFHFSTFFGGNDVSWAPEKTEAVFFDEFRIEIP